MIRFSLSLFVLMIGAISCEEKLTKSFESHTPFIVGGIVSQPNAWPSQVFIKLSYTTYFTFGSNGRHRINITERCGGTLLNSTHVLTAAHCVSYEFEVELFGRTWEIPIIPNEFYPTHSSMFTVYAGAHDISFAFNTALPVPATVRVLNVTAINTHQRYDPITDLNDIALFRITPSILQQTNQIRYAVLPPSSTAIPAVNVVGTVVGWGDIEDGGPSSNVLRQVDISVLQMNPNCNLHGSVTSALTQICAGWPNGGRDTCDGDSGSGFYVLDGQRWMTVGIVSYGRGCGLPRAPSIYTRVGAYINWIQTGRV